VLWRARRFLFMQPRTHKWRHAVAQSEPARVRIFGYATVPLGGWFLQRVAEPDIHLQSETPKSPYRGLSLCSLPFPEQFGESLGSLRSFAQSAMSGTWQFAHSKTLMFFPS